MISFFLTNRKVLMIASHIPIGLHEIDIVSRQLIARQIMANTALSTPRGSGPLDDAILHQSLEFLQP